MPFVETRFISPTTLTTSAASALYTVPTGYSAIIKQLVVTNITGTAATFTFYIGAASAGNALFSGTSVAANDTVIINLSQVLTTGEVLRALASTGSALNLTVSGVLNDGPLASTATYIADNAITSAKIADGAIVNADINASAAIAVSKLAPSSSSGQVLMGGASGAPTYITASGDVTIDQAGVTAIKSNVSLTGAPTAPTASAGTNTTQLATTEFSNTAGGLVFVKSQAVGSGVGSVTVSSAFSATYDNYVVVYQGGTVSTPANINLALGSSTTTYFQSLVYGQYSDTAPSFAGTNNNRTSWAWAGGGDTNSVFVNVTLMAPFLSYYTRLLGGTYNGPNASGWTSGIHKTASSYTAFTITPEAGTLSGGTVSVYGYRK